MKGVTMKYHPGYHPRFTIGSTITWISSIGYTEDGSGCEKFYATGTITQLTDAYVRVDIKQEGQTVDSQLILKQKLANRVEDYELRDIILNSINAFSNARIDDDTPHFVYRLIDPRDETTFYVGLSKNPTARLRQHLAGDTNHQKTTIIQDLKLLGIKPRLEICEEASGVTNGQARERYWIAFYLNQGKPLTNRPNVIEDFWANFNHDTRTVSTDPETYKDVRRIGQ